MALFRGALSPWDELAVVDSVGELAARLQNQPRADAVVLDLPAARRREAYQQIRERYRGRLLLAADQEAETHGWPADHARRFLIRPFPVAELSRALRMPIAPAVTQGPASAASPAAEAPRAAAPPAEPRPVEALMEPPPLPRRLSSDEPLWDPPTPPRLLAPAARAGTTAEAASGALPKGLRLLKANRPGALRVPLLLAAALVLLLGAGLGGVAIGRATARAAPIETISTSAPAPAPTVTSQAPAQTRTPPACDAALTDADAAISYLIAHITDQRLSKALEQFQNDRRACRQVK